MRIFPRPWAVLLFLAATGGVSSAAGVAGSAASDDLLDLVPATADSIICVNVWKMVDNPASARLLVSGLLKGRADHLHQFREATGIDPLRDIDQACFARSMALGEPSSVLLIKGRYDEDHLTRLLSLARGTLETTTVGSLSRVSTWVEPGGKRKFQAFLPGGRVALAFSREAMEGVEAALRSPGQTFRQRFAGPLAMLPPDYKDSIAWLYVPNPGKSPFASDAPATLHVQSFGAMYDLKGENLVLKAVSQIDSPEYVDDLRNMVDGLLAFAKLQNGNPTLSRLAHKVRVTSGESSSTLSAEVSMAVDEALALAEPPGRPRHRPGAHSPEDAARAEVERTRAELQRRKAEMARKQAELQRTQARFAAEVAALQREMRDLERRMGGTTDVLTMEFDEMPMLGMAPPPHAPHAPLPPQPPQPPQRPQPPQPPQQHLGPQHAGPPMQTFNRQGNPPGRPPESGAPRNPYDGQFGGRGSGSGQPRGPYRGPDLMPGAPPSNHVPGPPSQRTAPGSFQDGHRPAPPPGHQPPGVPPGEAGLMEDMLSLIDPGSPIGEASPTTSSQEGTF